MGVAWWGRCIAAPAAFVGREDELSHLLVALGGDTRLVLVVGDAGVGKTRFTGARMARAAVAETGTVRGECLPLAGTLPLLPVAAALGELSRIVPSMTTLRRATRRGVIMCQDRGIASGADALSRLVATSDSHS